MTTPTHHDMLGVAAQVIDACKRRIDAQDRAIAVLVTERETLRSRVAALTAQLRRREREVRR